MATYSSVLAWRIPGPKEPGRLPSMGLHRVGHDWSDLAAAAAVSYNSGGGKGGFYFFSLSKQHRKCYSLSHVQLFATPWTVSPPGSSVHGILQAGILQWVAIPFSRGSSPSRGWTWVSHIAGRFFTIWATNASGIETRLKSFKRGQQLCWCLSSPTLTNLGHETAFQLPRMAALHLRVLPGTMAISHFATNVTDWKCGELRALKNSHDHWPARIGI